MNPFHALVRQATVEPLGWTLLHFLWQGVLIAALFSVLQTVFRSSNVRYATGCGALLLMLAAPAFTFGWLRGNAQSIPIATTPMVSAPTAGSAPADAAVHPARVAGAEGNISGLRDFALRRLEGHLPWIVSVWLMGVSLLAVRLVIGSLQVYRVRRFRNEPLGEPYLERFHRLRAALKVSRPVRLAQSALIEVPAVIGWLRPVLLVPVGTLAGLDPAQLESILAHELAHIRRYDYLVNMMQHVVEALLFYHPAVWWVSHRIRVEREHCCDDLVVEVCGDRLGYARALATLEELRRAPASLAVAAGGGSLLARIRRLYGAPTSAGSLSWPGGIFVATSTLLAAVFLLFLNHPAVAQAESGIIPAPLAQSEDMGEGTPMDDAGKGIADKTNDGPSQSPPGDREKLLAKLQAAGEALRQLLIPYTEAHPLVKEQRARIQALQRQLTSNAGQDLSPSKDAGATGSDVQIFRTTRVVMEASSLKIKAAGTTVAEVEVLRPGNILAEARAGGLEGLMDSGKKSLTFQAPEAGGLNVQIPSQGQEPPITIMASQIEFAHINAKATQASHKRILVRSGGVAVAEIRLFVSEPGNFAFSSGEGGKIWARKNEQGKLYAIGGESPDRIRMEIPIQGSGQPLVIIAPEFVFAD